MPKIKEVDDELNWIFYCPGCKTHHGISTREPRPWNWNGDVNKPTFSPSLLVKMGPLADPITHLAPKDAPHRVCHSFIKDGFIQFLGDCTHQLAGQTVEIPEIEGD